MAFLHVYFSEDEVTKKKRDAGLAVPEIKVLDVTEATCD